MAFWTSNILGQYAGYSTLILSSICTELQGVLFKDCPMIAIYFVSEWFTISSIPLFCFPSVLPQAAIPFQCTNSICQLQSIQILSVLAPVQHQRCAWSCIPNFESMVSSRRSLHAATYIPLQQISCTCTSLLYTACDAVYICLHIYQRVQQHSMWDGMDYFISPTHCNWLYKIPKYKIIIHI